MKSPLSILAGLALAATGLLSSCDSSTDSSGGGSATIPWNSSITYGSVTDSRDSKVYKTVKIGTQTWMAENLNFRNTTGKPNDTVGVCYKNSADSCAKYGRLYTWAEVMAGQFSSTASPSGVQGLCPADWHVPSDTEWSILRTFVDPTNATFGTKLKSTSGWIPTESSSGDGIDAYGFRALPGGGCFAGPFFDAGYGGVWWSATDPGNETGYALHDRWEWEIHNTSANVFRAANDGANGFSLRCLAD